MSLRRKLTGIFIRRSPSCGRAMFSLLAACLCFLPLPTTYAQDVWTYHNDNARTAQNLSETILTPKNVNQTTFGKLFVISVDGRVDAQPLYLSALTVAGATHNVLFVATEHDSVYAFDADTGVQLWQNTLLPSGESTAVIPSCTQISPIGITSTPVIDRNSGPNGTIYAVAMSQDALQKYHQRLYALDVTTGQVLGTPTEIQATYPGSGPNSQGNQVIFNPGQYKERSALLLVNHVIYTTWASHCDHSPYNGWIIGYDETTLAQVNVLNITPNGDHGAFWSSGGGPAADANGNIYLLDGNGTFETTLDANGFPTQQDFGNSFLKLAANGGSLTVADYFNMFNTGQETNVDTDFGSGAPLLLPDLTDVTGQTRHLAIGAGKDTNVYVVDRDNMGKFNPMSNLIFQELEGVLPNGVWSVPAFFNNTIYYGPVRQPILAFQFSNGQFTATPVSRTVSVYPYPGASPSISANQNANGILWAVENASNAVLHAYDATNLSVELYNSNQASSGRDHFGSGNRFITPTIANGKVYVGTSTGVGVLGLLPAVTATNLSSSLNPAALGQTVTLTAQVTSATGTPTGTVTFNDSSNSLGAVGLDNTGTATFATSSLTSGSHSITAAYSGDANHAASTSAAINQVVVQQGAAAALSSSQNPSVFGQPIKFSASVRSVSGPVPTGTVSFTDATSNLALGSASLDGNGNASITTGATTLTAGSHVILAAYSGDTNYAAITATLTQIVNKSTTMTTVASSANPEVHGTSVTFTATVGSPGGATPTSGDVQLLDGTTVIATVTLHTVNGGVASFTTSSLVVGTHAIRTHYRGNGNFLSSTSAVLLQTVSGLPGLQIALSSSLNPSLFGNQVTLTAALSSPSNPTPTGTVTFNDTGSLTTLGAAKLDSHGNASITPGTTTLTAGSHAILATYSGDTNYAGTSGNITQTVNKATTTATVSSSVNPSATGASVTFTATVTSSTGAQVSTGDVQFLDGTTVIGTITLTSSSGGVGKFATSTLSVGVHSITSHYRGNGNLLSSTSTVLSQTVITLLGPQIALTSNLNPSTFGQPLTFDASVTSTTSPAPTGQVTFTDTTTSLSLGVAPLDGTGNATVTTGATSLTGTSHTIRATYSGDTNYASGSATLTQTVNKANSTAAISSSANPSTAGTTVTFTAIVSSAVGAPTSGDVQFIDGTTVIGTVTLHSTSGGVATFSTSTLAVGTHSMTSHYRGNGNFNHSTSTVLSQVIN
jgi:hypothetical protein